ncbi:hypothetical protein ISF_07267 [Cordyceps fumosorosea ARSEF 2679]|uniref:Uncharacterized protein n=1 Tax=Cordyceps fumosorosea (strain ARSEF 2679) TaxID=1081104 RepID=A0A167PKG0_CORFA|nr:hypothetical protein ISF_07267 [Cordyceps fumosorosea ARSEF 2679]OAA56751.1 hypothetical protein ISF_07267 [Cordyceps fumosorosea ARSEF 2679]
MKSFIALPLLAAAALAAPQLEARDDATTKPVKEADTSRADCWKKDPNVHWMLPASATRNEDCTGTIEYCLRGFYSRHGEEFDDADACLRSRGLDPATAVDAMRIVSRDDYSKGFSALQEANQIYNRYMLLTQLSRTTVSDEKDKEANDFINQILWSNENRVDQARKAISNAKSYYKRAFGSKHDDEVEAGIEEAKRKLNAAWAEVKDKDVEQLRNMYDWFKERSEEKYYHNW